MSGQTPKVLSATTGAVLLPNTGGSRFVLGVAIAALGIGLVTLAVSGAVSLKQRMNKA
jgi:hypothetical protein